MEPWQIQDLIITVAVSIAVLIPITGLTLRFGLKPFLRDLGQLKAARHDRRNQLGAEDGDRLERIEIQLDTLERSLRHLTEVVQFDRQLMPGSDEGRRSDGEAS
jgi:hypothetical protein